jgi:hypothetical protein
MDLDTRSHHWQEHMPDVMITESPEPMTLWQPASAQAIAEGLVVLSKAGQRVRPWYASQHHKPEWDANTLRLDMHRLTSVRKVSPDDFIIRVESGLTCHALQILLAEQHQELPLAYLPETPLWAILGEDRPSLETGLTAGYPRDAVLAIEIATPDGQLTQCGADVVKNVTGYDLNKLYVGADHTLGIITAVTLKLSPKPDMTRSWLFGFSHLEQAVQSARQILEKPYGIRRCELFSSQRLHEADSQELSQGSWSLLVQAAGDSERLKPLAPAIRHQITYPESETILMPARESQVADVLMHWPANAMVIECALPVGSWQAGLESVMTILKPYPQLMCQVRPAAGLVTAILPGSTMANADIPILHATLARLKATITQANGFVRLTQYPDSFAQFAAKCNFPDDSVARDWMLGIKRQYDPANILTSRLLPFEHIPLHTP